MRVCHVSYREVRVSCLIQRGESVSWVIQVASEEAKHYADWRCRSPLHSPSLSLRPSLPPSLLPYLSLYRCACVGWGRLGGTGEAVAPS